MKTKCLLGLLLSLCLTGIAHSETPTAPFAILIKDGDLYKADLPDGEPKLLVDHDGPAINSWNTRHIRIINEGRTLFYSSMTQKQLDHWRMHLESPINSEPHVNDLDYWLFDLADMSKNLLFSRADCHSCIPSPNAKWVAVCSKIKPFEVGNKPAIWDVDARASLIADSVKSSQASIGIDVGWSTDSSRLLYMETFTRHDDRPRLQQIEVPSMRVEKVADILHEGDSAWFNEKNSGDKFVIFGGESTGFRSVRRASVCALDLSSGIQRHAPLPAGEVVAYSLSPRPSEVYVLTQVQNHLNAYRREVLAGNIYLVDWESGQTKSFPCPGMSFSSETDHDYTVTQFGIFQMNGQDHFLIGRTLHDSDRKYWEPALSYIHTGAIGSADAYPCFSGYTLGGVYP